VKEVVDLKDPFLRFLDNEGRSIAKEYRRTDNFAKLGKWFFRAGCVSRTTRDQETGYNVIQRCVGVQFAEAPPGTAYRYAENPEDRDKIEWEVFAADPICCYTPKQ